MKDFNPMFTRKQQGLAPIPAWLYSLKAQKELLREKGLHEVTVGNDKGVWSTVERIKAEIREEPTWLVGGDYLAVDVRGNRREFINGQNYNRNLDPNPDSDPITEREKKAYEDHVQSMINRDLYRSWKVVVK